MSSEMIGQGQGQAVLTAMKRSCYPFNIFVVSTSREFDFSRTMWQVN